MQGTVKTYSHYSNGKEYWITNVFQFETFDYLKNSLTRKYALKFQEIDEDEIMESYEDADDKPTDIWNLF